MSKLESTFENHRTNFLLTERRRDLIFMGLGISGVYAIFAALMFRQYSKGVPKVVTFGQPRMGNIAFASFVDSKLEVYRITHADDQIPSFPSDKLYNHLRMEYWIPKQNQCDCETKPLEVYMCFVKNSYAENPQCNLQFSFVNILNDRSVKDSHWGPYFGYDLKYNDVIKELRHESSI
ncbi:hypothetical protein G9A89_010067 [Geosiphon pyriformis]|nr:hypothetical protein G9A89_010067 [Geosiphon pyriformis]